MVFKHHFFKTATFLLIAAAIHAIGIKKEDVPCIHERELGHARRLHASLPIVQREVAVPVRMVFGDLQAEREKLHHPALVQFHESAKFRRVNEWRRMSEIHKSKVAGWPDFAIQHRGDLLYSI